MKILLGTCCLTTAIAIISVFSAGHASLQRRILPWVGGLLVGIAVFWILPEMAGQRGWVPSLVGVSAILLVAAWFDRHVYPICPFCAAGVHADPTCRPKITFGWPLLVVGCIHSFFDGWTIAQSQVASSLGAATALSWAAIVHKIPESVAIGILAARLTSSRTRAVQTVGLVQAAMALGGLSAILAGKLEPRWSSLYSVPACAILLLFGLLALQQEWRFRGYAAALRAAGPGLLGCGLAALAGQLWRR